MLNPMMDQEISFAVLTVSDSCSEGLKNDFAGPAVQQEIKRRFSPSEIVSKLVADNRKQISDILISWCNKKINVILTVGGTGCSPRDVTPEATKDVIDKEVPGIALNILKKSLEVTEMAMLSRSVCGIREQSLIINLPGSTKGAKECFSFITSVIPHAVALINEDKVNVVKKHEQIQNVTKECGLSKVKINVPALRNRNSPYEMLEVKDAQNIIISETVTGEPTLIDYRDSLNRVLAEDLISKDPLPPFRASIKDGYAVKSAGGNADRKVIDFSAAGDQPNKNFALKEDEAIRISTGAPIPEGADAVVQVEDTILLDSTPDGQKELKIGLKEAPSVGQDIREIGSDIKANSRVASQLEVITPGHVGIMATIGKTTVQVFERASVGIISTGNEIVEPCESLAPGQIRNSNTFSLISLLNKYSYNATNCGIARDNPNSLKEVLYNALNAHDIVITTGGVSMGEFDLVKQVLIEDFNALIFFGRVNMKPGKPTTFATLNFKGKKKLIFSLPGNPVSACVSCLLFVVPCLRYAERQKKFMFTEVATAYNQIEVKRILDADRPNYARGTFSIFDANMKLSPYFSLTGPQASSKINSLAGANSLLIIPKKCDYRRENALSCILLDNDEYFLSRK